MKNTRQKRENKKPERAESRNSFSTILKPIVDRFRKKEVKRVEPREPAYFSWAIEADNDER